MKPINIVLAAMSVLFISVSALAQNLTPSPFEGQTYSRGYQCTAGDATQTRVGMAFPSDVMNTLAGAEVQALERCIVENPNARYCHVNAVTSCQEVY
jgi:hypothetical protein